MTLASFTQIWLVEVDRNESSEIHEVPRRLSALEIQSDKCISLNKEQLMGLSEPPYSITDDSLIIFYQATRVLTVHLMLGWPQPSHVIDLSVELRNLVNGTDWCVPGDLLQALDYLRFQTRDNGQRLPKSDGAIDARSPIQLEKVGRSHPTGHLQALWTLWNQLKGDISLPYALLRGNFMSVAAKVESRGIPIDAELHLKLTQSLPILRAELIRKSDVGFNFYTGSSFRQENLERWAKSNHPAWPRHRNTGLLKSDVDTFEEQAALLPALREVADLRKSLPKLRDIHIPIDSDARSRAPLLPFSSKTGRNQPSSNAFIFNSPSWLRFLIKPPSGRILVELDWAQQEFGIAAAISGDAAMKRAYLSGDPYLAFAKQAGAVPGDATRESHSRERDCFKTCALGVLYGLGVKALAGRIGQDVLSARRLIAAHKRAYSRFWEWSEGTADYVRIQGSLHTVFDWRCSFGDVTKQKRSILNFPMQANGAEMMRLAACTMHENHVQICAIMHDGFLIEATEEDGDGVIMAAQDSMTQASQVVLDGFPLRSDMQVVRWPNRYRSAKGQALWDLVRMSSCIASGLA